MATYLCPGLPQELFGALADAIGAELVVVTERSGPDPDDDPIRSGAVDLAWVCSTSYVELMNHREPSVVLAGLAWVPDDESAGGQPRYHSEIVTRRDSKISGFDDLAGARLGGNDEASLSGYHALLIELRRRGLDVGTFADIVLTGGHLTSLDLVLAGELDAAVVDSMVYESQRRRTPEIDHDLEVAARLGPWPTQPLVARRSMPVAEIEHLRRMLLRVNDDPGLRTLFHRSGVSHLTEVGPDHCDPVLDAVAG